MKKIITMLLLACGWAWGDIYWVSPTGAATWANAKSATPLSGTDATTIATANTYIAAGDTLYLRAGTYITSFVPTNSGTSVNKILVSAYSSEVPELTGGSKITAINLSGKDYYKFSRISIHDVYRFVSLVQGADHNEFVDCTMYNTIDTTGACGIIIWSLSAPPSTNNWFHNCTIYGAGYAGTTDCDDNGYIMQMGVFNADNTSGNNTVENCNIYWGGHHLIEINTAQNVIRNNKFRNNPHMDSVAACNLCTDGTHKYGNRNLGLDGAFCLIENNRVGHGGLSPDGNGADGIAIADSNIIIRHNKIFDNEEDGAYFRYGNNVEGGYGPSKNCAFYNNTLYHNGHHLDCRDDMPRSAINMHATYALGNIMVNNLLWDNHTWTEYTKPEIMCSGADCSSNLAINNWMSDSTNPLLNDTIISDADDTTRPALELNAGSPCINKGIALALAKGAGVSSTKLCVDATYARFFQDGTWGSSLSDIGADYIAIGTVSNTVQIASIDYTNDTLVLYAPKSWSDNDSIWLYKNSSGTVVLHGSAPDLGAYEYQSKKQCVITINE